MKRFFPKKKFLFILFSSFSNFPKILKFCQKNVISRSEKRFPRKIPFDTRITPNLPHLLISKRNPSFFEKHIYFFQKQKTFWSFWAIAPFQSHSMENLSQFDERKSRSDKKKTADVGVNASGKRRTKRTWEIAHLRQRFCFHQFNVAQTRIFSTRVLQIFMHFILKSHRTSWKLFYGNITNFPFLWDYKTFFKSDAT